MDEGTSPQGHSRGCMEDHQTRSRLVLSLGCTLGLIVVEALAGLLANSLALLTDAAHNLTDAVALGMTWFALRMQARPSGAANTYGYHRAGILVALANSSGLVLLSLGIFYEAYQRLLAPPEVRSQILILVGMLAVVINLVTALLIRRRGETDLNLRSAFIHLMGDVTSTAAAVVAGVIIYFTGATWLDPLVSVMIGILIIRAAWSVLREAIDILLESTPRDVDLTALVRAIRHINGVLGVHDLHVWSITRDLRTMSAHVLIEDGPASAGSRIQKEVTGVLVEQYRITHATLQLECIQCVPHGLYCDLDAGRQGAGE
jgi:cobalt-zinc-cadmium efflux system protein